MKSSYIKILSYDMGIFCTNPLEGVRTQNVDRNWEVDSITERWEETSLNQPTLLQGRAHTLTTLLTDNNANPKFLNVFFNPIHTGQIIFKETY